MAAGTLPGANFSSWCGLPQKKLKYYLYTNSTDKRRAFRCFALLHGVIACAGQLSPPPGMGMVRPASGMQPVAGSFQNEDNLYSGPYQMVKVSGSVRPILPALAIDHRSLPTPQPRAVHLWR